MNTTDLFQRIAAAHPTIHGWCELDKAFALAAAVVTLRPKTIVEIGVYGGRSLIPMALAAEACGTGNVFAIDPWQAASSVEGMDQANSEWWSKLDHESIYKHFIGHVIEQKLVDRVTVWRMSSNNAPVPASIDLLHTDGNHGEQAYRDTVRFAPAVRVGGLCCMDDIAWTGGGVQRGVEFLLKHGFVELYKIGTGAMFQRVG